MCVLWGLIVLRPTCKKIFANTKGHVTGTKELTMKILPLFGGLFVLLFSWSCLVYRCAERKIGRRAERTGTKESREREERREGEWGRRGEGRRAGEIRAEKVREEGKEKQKQNLGDYFFFLVLLNFFSLFDRVLRWRCSLWEEEYWREEDWKVNPLFSLSLIYHLFLPPLSSFLFFGYFLLSSLSSHLATFFFLPSDRKPKQHSVELSSLEHHETAPVPSSPSPVHKSEESDAHANKNKVTDKKASKMLAHVLLLFSAVTATITATIRHHPFGHFHDYFYFWSYHYHYQRHSCCMSLSQSGQYRCH